MILHRRHKWVFFVHGDSMRTEIKWENMDILPCYPTEWLWESQKCMQLWIEHLRFITVLTSSLCCALGQDRSIKYPHPPPTRCSDWYQLIYSWGCHIAGLSSHPEQSRNSPSCLYFEKIKIRTILLGARLKHTHFLVGLYGVQICGKIKQKISSNQSYTHCMSCETETICMGRKSKLS